MSVLHFLSLLSRYSSCAIWGIFDLNNHLFEAQFAAEVKRTTLVLLEASLWSSCLLVLSNFQFSSLSLLDFQSSPYLCIFFSYPYYSSLPEPWRQLLIRHLTQTSSGNLFQESKLKSLVIGNFHFSIQKNLTEESMSFLEWPVLLEWGFAVRVIVRKKFLRNLQFSVFAVSSSLRLVIL